MADVTVQNVTAQLSQWAFDKPLANTRPQRPSSDSTASSPNLADDVLDTLRLDAAAQPPSSPAARKESLVLQERYLSSEEDLTADDGSDSGSEYDYEDAVIYDAAKECKARTMSISRWDKGKSCDMAVTVSYAFAGRPKVVEMDCRAPTPPHERPGQQRAASVAHLPLVSSGSLKKSDEAQRRSMNVLASTRYNTITTPVVPKAEEEPRRPSTSYSPATQQISELHHSDTASTYSSFQTAPSTRSISVTSNEMPRRPSTSTSTAEPVSSRSSVYIPSRSRLDLTQVQTTQTLASYRQSQLTPLTPSSPALSFLSSDPYENSTTNSSSPIIKKPATHKRLRSISMKLALAKIAIAPAKKPYDARINGGKTPLTPSTPYTPVTPQTAPLEGSSGFPGGNKLRRASTILRPKSRSGPSVRPPTPESAPPVPPLQKRMTFGSSRMVARGADEREPTLVLPPCPDASNDDRVASIRAESRRLKKRKSLMDFMDSLA